MKRNGVSQPATDFCKPLAIMLLAWAVALTGLPRWQPARAHAAPAKALVALAAPPQLKTDFELYPVLRQNLIRL
jgi:hypothetical protein